MIKELKKFFDRPGINKAGICKEAGLSQQYVNRILSGRQPLTDSFLEKLLPVCKNYGFQIGK